MSRHRYRRPHVPMCCASIVSMACNYAHAWCEGPKPSPRDKTIAPPVRCTRCTRDSQTTVPLLDALAGEEFSS